MVTRTQQRRHVVTGIGSIVAGPADDIDEALRFYCELLGTRNATVQQRRSDGRCLS
jgi:hypothetical protein